MPITPAYAPPQCTPVDPACAQFRPAVRLGLVYSNNNNNNNNNNKFDNNNDDDDDDADDDDDDNGNNNNDYPHYC